MQTFSVLESTLNPVHASKPVKLAKKDFDRLLAELSPAILRYCLRYLRNPDDAQEACQETMLKALNGYANFEGRASVKNWLYSIAKNVCTSLYQQRSKLDLIEDCEDLFDEATFTPESPDEGPCLFGELITRLTVQERNVLSFRFKEDLQLPEIACALDLNISTVKMCYYRALDKFQIAQAS